jgi:hypothetical protein
MATAKLVATMTTPPTHNSFFAQGMNNSYNSMPRTEREILMMELSYNEMTVGANGSVMDRKEKAALREKNGFCVECQGVPVELYRIKKKKLNPLFFTKDPVTSAGRCMDGVCFVCHPDKDPNQRKKRFHRASLSQRTLENVLVATNGMVPPSTAGKPQNHQPPSSSAPILLNRNALDPQNNSYDLGEEIVTAEVRPAEYHHDAQQIPRPRAASPPPPDHSNSLANTRSPVSTMRPYASPSNSQRPSLGRRQSMRPKPVFNNPGVFVVAPDTSVPLVSFVDVKLPGFDETMGDNLEQIFTNAMDRSTRHLDVSSSRENSESQLSGLTTEVDSGTEASRLPLTKPTTSTVGGDATAHQEDLERKDSGYSNETLSTPELSDTGNGHSYVLDVATMPTAALHQAQALLEDETETARIIEHAEALVHDVLTNPDADPVFLVEIILGPMREYPTRVRVQEYGAGAIWDICKDENQNKEFCMAAGAPQDIIRAMERFPESLDLQDKGCGAIWSLGANSDNRVVLVRQGACERIVKALEIFAEVESFVQTAIGSLRTLSPELEAREAFKLLDASAVTARAMGLHRSSVSIQRDGCAFLSNCAVDIEKQVVAVVPLEELDAVVKAMQFHREEVAVMAGGCFALKNYTYEQANRRTLRLCDDIEELFAHAASFERSAACRTDAAELLERMQLSRVADESMESHALLQLRTSMSASGEPMQKLRTITEFIRGNDWSPRLLSSAAAFLRELVSEDDGIVDELLKSGCLKDVIRYIMRHGRDVELMEEGCRLLATIADGSETNEDRQNDLIEAGQATAIFTILETHLDNRQMVGMALAALNPLSNNFYCWCEAEGEGQKRIDIVRNAVARHPDCDTVGMNGVGVISSHAIFA